MSQVKENKKKKQQTSRRFYKTPHLQAYGTVKDLTASGTGTKPESDPGADKNQQRP